MSLGEKIREERMKLKISQLKLGEILSVSQQAVGKWEKDLAEPDASNLKKLAKLFNVSVDYLLENNTLLNINQTPIVETYQLSEIQENFISEFKEFFAEKTFWKYAQLYQAMDRDTRIFALGYLCSYLKNVGMNVDAFLK